MPDCAAVPHHLPETHRASVADSSSSSSAPLRLGDRARAALRLRHMSPRTEEAYIQWMRRYYEFHGRQNPVELGAEHVTMFLNALAIRDHVTASTQNQALARQRADAPARRAHAR